MVKLDLKHGDYVGIVNTGSELDGKHARVIGLASRHVVDIYILEHVDCNIHSMPDFGKYTAFVMPESCLRKVE